MNINPEQIISFLLLLRATFVEPFLMYQTFWKALSVLISLALALGIGYTIFRLWVLGVITGRAEFFVEVATAKNLSRRRSIKAWNQIQKRLQVGDEAHMKLALIEADKILDEILKISGFRGETMAERLQKLTPAQIPNINKLWIGHKVRNRIVHEPDFTVSREDILELIEEYRKAFKGFGLLE